MAHLGDSGGIQRRRSTVCKLYSIHAERNPLDWMDKRELGAIADVVCVLLHFKFTDGLAAKATRIADDSNSDPTWATEHRLYKEFFSANASLLGSHRAYKYGSVMDLANKGFLYVSPTYRAFI